GMGTRTRVASSVRASPPWAARYGAATIVKSGVWRTAVSEMNSTGTSRTASRGDRVRARNAVANVQRSATLKIMPGSVVTSGTAHSWISRGGFRKWNAGAVHVPMLAGERSDGTNAPIAAATNIPLRAGCAIAPSIATT